MSSQQTSWHMDVLRSLARFNLAKQLPRRPPVPKTWAFLPRQWPVPTIATSIPGFGLSMNLLAQHNLSSSTRYSRSDDSLASYDSCLSTLDRGGRPSFVRLDNYGARHDFDTSSSCSSSSYSELHTFTLYPCFDTVVVREEKNGTRNV